MITVREESIVWLTHMSSSSQWVRVNIHSLASWWVRPHMFCRTSNGKHINTSPLDESSFRTCVFTLLEFKWSLLLLCPLTLLMMSPHRRSFSSWVRSCTCCRTSNRNAHQHVQWCAIIAVGTESIWRSLMTCSNNEKEKEIMTQLVDAGGRFTYCAHLHCTVSDSNRQWRETTTCWWRPFLGKCNKQAHWTDTTTCKLTALMLWMHVFPCVSVKDPEGVWREVHHQHHVQHTATAKEVEENAHRQPHCEAESKPQATPVKRKPLYHFYL